MSIFDIVIKNGMIVDGARSPRFRGDIGIKDGVITKIGSIHNADAARIIDASGLIVAPGIIDLHTHYDAQVFWDPYLTISGSNGVTSVVTGNCGYGFAPVAPELRDRAMRSMTRVEAIPLTTMQSELPWDWVSFPEFLDSMERQPKSVNIVPFLGLTPLLIWVLGLEGAKAGRKPNAAEHAEMAKLLNEAMDAGACGWSTYVAGEPGKPESVMKFAPQQDYDGTPMPSDIMWPETRLALAKVLGDRGDGFIAMTAPNLSFEHWEELAEVSGAPLLWQAVYPSDGMVGAKANKDILTWLNDCQERGLRIYGQGITSDPPLCFTFDYWDLWSSEWADLAGPQLSKEQKLKNFADPAVREQLRAAPLKPVIIASIPDTILHRTYSEAYKAFEGMRVGDVAEKLGKHPVDLVCDIVVADNLKTIFETRQFDATLEGIKNLIDHPFVIPGLSDGGAHLKYLADGTWGTEYLSKYVREHHFSTLEDAHWRLSALPAFCAGFENRGTLQVGSAADIIVYDYENLTSTYPEFRDDLPGGEYRLVADGVGYKYVLVNGQVTIEDDKPTNVHSGCLLRRGKPRTETGMALAAE